VLGVGSPTPLPEAFAIENDIGTPTKKEPKLIELLYLFHPISFMPIPTTTLLLY
jgi:hypothetical protein